MSTEDELIMLRLIEGMHHSAFKQKVLETFQSVNLTVETSIEFVQELELIKSNQYLNKGEAYSSNKYEILRKFCRKRRVLGNNCPAVSKACSICKQKNHAPKVCRYKKIRPRKLKTLKGMEEKLKFSR